MKTKRLLKELGTFAFCLSGAFLIAALVLGMFPAFRASAAVGTIWTNTTTCGTPGQDVNHFAIGEHVYIHGENFDPNTSYPWSITGKPGSNDPNIIVASGDFTTDGAGTFCFDAYTVAADDGGEYGVDFGGKKDNYGVDAVAVTATFTPSNTFTDTPTETFTNTPTGTLTNTLTNTPTDTPTGTLTNTLTNTPTGTPSGTFIPPSNTPTGTSIPPTIVTLPSNTPSGTPVPPSPTFTPSYTPTGTFVPPTATNTPTSGITKQATLPVPSPDPGDSTELFPVTGVDQGAFYRGLPTVFTNACLVFFGLGLVLHGLARRFGK